MMIMSIYLRQVYNVRFHVKRELLSKALASIENMADWLCNKFLLRHDSNKTSTNNDYATVKEYLQLLQFSVS